MNMYFVYADGHIVTPETGTILEGITRSAIIELAQQEGPQGRGAQVLDRRVARGRGQRRHHRGLRLRHRGGHHAGRHAEVGRRRGLGSPTDDAGPLTLEIRQDLVDIQYGRTDDAFGWMHRVC